MNKLTIFLFFVSMASYSQTMGELEERKEQLRSEIQILQDSLKSVEKDIQLVKQRAESEDQGEISVLSETLYLNTLKDTPMLSLPGKLGDTITIAKKGARAQIIDKNKGYYLACISDNCGYILVKDLNTKKN